MDIHLEFGHGLGDNANFAHLLPLYIKRGYEVYVTCHQEKVPLFLAAGAHIEDNQKNPSHPFSYPRSLPPDWDDPAAFSTGNYFDAHLTNKIFHAINSPIMPLLEGDPAKLWEELKQVKLSCEDQFTQTIKNEVNSYVDGLPRPLIIIHPQGDISTEDLTIDEQLVLLNELLDRTEGTIITLDWHDRCAKVNNYRSRHLLDDFKPFTLLQTLYLLTISDLFIGVDSGWLNTVLFTDTPSIGVWPHHHPASFVIPRQNTLHLVKNKFQEYDNYRRIEFNTICSDEEYLTGEFITDYAVKMLAKPRWLNNIVQDVQLQSFLGKTKNFYTNLGITYFVDRYKTFGRVMDYLVTLDEPVMTETGTICDAVNFKDWESICYSTYLFGCLFYRLGRGKYYSIDLNTTNCAFARQHTACFSDFVEVIEGHSHDVLANFQQKMDVFYSDSLDVEEPGYQESCIKEIELALPLINGLILIDDTVWNGGRSISKWVSLQNATHQHDYIIIRPGQEIITSNHYSGPLEINFVFRTNTNVSKRDMRIDAGRGGCVILNWEANPSRLRVNRPNGNENLESGEVLETAISPLWSGDWQNVVWRITENNMSLTINGKEVFTDNSHYDLSYDVQVRIRSCGEARVDVKNFLIKKPNEPSLETHCRPVVLGRPKFVGKGGLAVPFLLENGWQVLAAGYQCLLGRKT